MPTQVKTCDCKNQFQDKRYGRRRRVWNMMGINNGWRCTSCGKEDKSSK